MPCMQTMRKSQCHLTSVPLRAGHTQESPPSSESGGSIEKAAGRKPTLRANTNGNVVLLEVGRSNGNKLYLPVSSFQIQDLNIKNCHEKMQCLPPTFSHLSENAIHSASPSTKSQDAQVSTWGALLLSQGELLVRKGLVAFTKETEDTPKDEFTRWA